jgi:hypothetical protein
MSKGSYIQNARDKVLSGNFFLSHHAQIERGEEEITVDDIVACILKGIELEPYPNDPRGESCLIVGKDNSDQWLHVVCGSFCAEHLLIITVYRPQLPKWSDPFTRRK